MRFRPANIRVINRRENYLDHDLRCLLRAIRRKQLLLVDRSFHIRTMVATLTAFCFVGFGTDRLRKQAMKIARRRKPKLLGFARSRAHGAAGQNRSCSNKWAEKQEKLRPLQWCFFLTSPCSENLIRRRRSLRG